MRIPGRRTPYEYWGIAVLLAILVASTLVFNKLGQEVTALDEPSSLNNQRPGAKALYLLLAQEHFRVDNLETTWNGLTSDTGLLVVIEPFDRSREAISRPELAALRDWIAKGGTLLYCVSDPPRPLDPTDSVGGDTEIISGPKGQVTVQPASRSAFTQNVARAVFDSPVRLRTSPGSPYETLFRDAHGQLVVSKKLGRGQVILAASSFAASNAGVQNEDNAIFLLNIAQFAINSSGRSIYFDEYHHGHGLEQAASADSRNELSILPLPARLVFAQLILLCCIVVYNGNRRFGRPLPMNPPQFAASTDYVGAMARLLRRARAADVALLTLYQFFLRDLRRKLDAGPTVEAATLAAFAARSFPTETGELATTLAECERVAQGERVSEGDLMRLARQLEDFRRKFNLVGSQ